MKRGFLKIIAPVLLAFSAASCITEVDVGMCDNTVVNFKYYADGSEDVFPDYISSVSCLLYDSENRLVSETDLTSAELTEFQGVRLQISDPGEYRMVCWGNSGVETTLTPDGDSGHHLATNTAFANGATPRTHDPLYLGTLEFSITHAGDIKEDFEVIFHAAHITLIATLEAGDNSRAAELDSYTLEIEGMPVAVTHLGETTGDMTTYKPEFKPAASSGLLTATCELPRFDENTPAMVHVVNNTLGEKAASVSLSKYISDNAIVLTGREEVIVEMTIRLNGTQVSITFPGWKHDQVTPRV
ncbi:MAG: FimB/Mfa2 family fimbrial subunit [Muribaculaceae bacterium]|nr:FimB/Mfa2 family fimbrial subunit [Muribaculaceae bacterium]